MKRLLLVLAILGLAAAPADASILGSLLSFDGIVDNIDDTSVAKIYSTDDYINDGDQIVGVLRFHEVDGNLTNNQVWGIFAIEVTGTRDGSDDKTYITHGPIDDEDSESLFSILTNLGLEPGLSGGDQDRAMFALIENSSAPSGLAEVFNQTPSDLFFDSDPYFDATNGWSLTAVAGFDNTNTVGGTPNVNLHGYTDFFEARLDSTLLTTISAIEANNTGAVIISENVGMSVLYHVFGSSVVFLPVDTLKGDEVNYSSEHDIVMSPGGQVSTTAYSNWSVGDDTSYLANATPEPMSICVWSGLIVFGAAAGYRRRRRSR